MATSAVVTVFLMPLSNYCHLENRAQLKSSWLPSLVEIETRCAGRSTAMLHGLRSVFLAASRS